MNRFDKIRLIVCDVDGTLYDWDRILSPRTIRVINELHERGYGFSIASGRPYEEIVEYADRWGFPFQFDVLIGLNGAELFSLKQNRLHEYYKLCRFTLIICASKHVIIRLLILIYQCLYR